jgi:nicotinate-nucleotide pyrophosphorylase (carboxylating)
MLTPAVLALIDLALEEDLGRGDVTAQTVLESQDGRAVLGNIIAKQPLVLFGLEVAAQVFARIDPRCRFTVIVPEGSLLAGQRDTVATIEGPAASVLAGERTALNFLQRLSGVATQSRIYADAVAGTSARVVDTRKTTPGLRALEKAAVLAGGCYNHRADLGSGILIKDNHIASVGGVGKAVRRALERAPHPLRVEVEVTTFEQLDEALAAGAHVVLLDNWPPDEMVRAVKRAHDKPVLVEISGGVTLETLPDIARTGVDLVSVGALTHSAPAVDLSLDIVG